MVGGNLSLGCPGRFINDVMAHAGTVDVAFHRNAPTRVDSWPDSSLHSTQENFLGQFIRHASET